jgi:hypothetical protein
MTVLLLVALEEVPAAIDNRRHPGMIQAQLIRRGDREP